MQYDMTFLFLSHTIHKLIKFVTMCVIFFNKKKLCV